jgi:sec-independent protein translocase protein TatA
MDPEMTPQIGVPELLIILLIVLFVFGVGKLPQIGKALGQGIREFREGTQGLAEEDTSGASSTKSGEA